MKKLLFLLSVLGTLSSFTMDKPAYRLFKGNGKALTYEKMLKELASADVVFLVSSTMTPSRIGCRWSSPKTFSGCMARSSC